MDGIDSNVPKHKPVNLVIDDEFACQRLDNFLFNKLKNIPKSHIYKMIRGGWVRINKKRVKPLYKIQLDDVVRIPPLWDTSSYNRPCRDLVVDCKDLPIIKNKTTLTKILLDSIIFEDDKMLVINKPSGIAVHSGSGINFGVIEIMRYVKPNLKNLELVHRLDRDTSGCLILAKKRSILRKLHELIRERKVLKKYVLLVRGKWKNGERTVDLSLLKNQLKSGERIVKVSEKGKRSVTVFRPIKTGKFFSLVEAELKTGRTHQIRVHAASIGYPIVGDKKYGNKECNIEMKKRGLKGMFLHAETISFYWPTGEKLKFVAGFENRLKHAFPQFL